MYRYSRHIASTLLAVLLLGTVLVPFVHEVHHAIEQLWPDEDLHVHPDYEALLDDSQHRLDTHVECILCSSQTTHFLGVADHQHIPVKQPGNAIQLVDTRVAAFALNTSPVRGPPIG